MLPLLLAVMIAQTTGTPPAPSQALMDRFVAAFPQEQRLEVFELRSDAAEGDRLIALNPTRAAEIRRAVETHSACASPVMARMTDNGLRWVAARLGDAKLAQIVRFFEDGDAAFLAGLDENALSEADRTRAQRILADYPLQDYFEAMEASVGRDEPLARELHDCDRARDDTYLRLDVRYPSEAQD